MKNSITFKETCHLIHSDLLSYEHHTGFLGGFVRLFSSFSFRITFWYRIGHYLVNSESRFKKIVFLPFVSLIHKHNAYLTGIQFPFEVICDEDLQFQHFGTIVVNPSTVLGRHCRIWQCVTIGSTRGETHRGRLSENLK